MEGDTDMSDEVVFQGKQIFETAEYFCSVVGDGGEVDADTQQLMSALRAMAWVIGQLCEVPQNQEIQHRLGQECAAIACHLLDKRCAGISDQRE